VSIDGLSGVGASGQKGVFLLKVGRWGFASALRFSLAPEVNPISFAQIAPGLKGGNLSIPRQGSLTPLLALAVR